MSVSASEIPGYIPGCWRIDPAGSELGISVRHLGISTVHGRFGILEGKIVTTDDPLRSKVTATIHLSSVDTGNEGRDRAIRSAKLIDVDSNTSALYRSTALRRDESAPGVGLVVDGELTMMDVTRPVSLRFQFDRFDLDPQGSPRVLFDVSGLIARRDFGLIYQVRPRLLDRAIGSIVRIRATVSAIPFY
jgi:polyisoprenoid-binding protein YceI